MKIIAYALLLIFIVSLPAFAAAPVKEGDATLEFRLYNGRPSYKHEFIVSVIFTTKEIPFDAYTVNLKYDSTLMYVTDIAGGSTPGYERVIDYLYEHNHVMLESFHIGSESTPIGEVEVARITFYVYSKESAKTSFTLDPVIGLNDAFYDDPNSLGFLFFNLTIIPFEIEINPPAAPPSTPTPEPPITGVNDWAIY